MNNLTAILVAIIALTIISCNGRKIRKGEPINSKRAFLIESKKFLFQKIDSTFNIPFFPGDTVSDDLSSEERMKYILTNDAVHKYKLVSIQKKTEDYIGIMVLYIMESGNKQYYITLDKTGRAISDLLVQSNHREGPIQLENGNVLMYSKINSYFNGDTITVVQNRVIAAGFVSDAKEWREVVENKYIINKDGKFDLLKY